MPLAAVGVWLLIVKGNYNSIEKIFLFASVIYVTYIISGILVKPDWKTAAINSVRPVLMQGDHVAIRWIFRFDWKDGTVTQMEEVARQRWQGERIAQEVFFYDPAQRVPKKL